MAAFQLIWIQFSSESKSTSYWNHNVIKSDYIRLFSRNLTRKFYIFTLYIIVVPLSIRLTSDRINKKRVMILISCIFQRKSHIAIDVNKAICWRTVNNEKCFICQQHVSAETPYFSYSMWYNYSLSLLTKNINQSIYCISISYIYEYWTMIVLPFRTKMAIHFIY